MADLATTYTARPMRRQPALTALMLLAGIAALTLGGWIYVTARPDTLLYSLWHGGMATEAATMPDFVVYSLPDGLWALSSILVLHSLLRHEPRNRRLPLVAAVPLLGIGSEFLQGFGWLPGVFDGCDLLCYAIPLASYLIYESCHNLTIFKS